MLACTNCKCTRQSSPNVQQGVLTLPPPHGFKPPDWLQKVQMLVPFASLLTVSRTYLTLFSKFFSSFPHGTCSLSVSWQYLALDEIYHPFWAAFPNNPTLWGRLVDTWSPSHERDCHPPWCCFPTDLNRGHMRKRLFSLQRAVGTTEL